MSRWWFLSCSHLRSRKYTDIVKRRWVSVWEWQRIILNSIRRLNVTGVAVPLVVSFLQLINILLTTGKQFSVCKFVFSSSVLTSRCSLLWGQQYISGSLHKLASMPPEKSVCRSRSNSKYWTWNSRLDPNWERSMSRLYIVALLI